MSDINNEMIGLLFGNEGLMKKFNKDSYKDAFYANYDKYRSLFNEIDASFKDAEDKNAYVDSIADAFVKYAADKEGAISKKSDKERFWVEHNSVLTVYVLPALLENRYESCNYLVKD